MKTKFLFCSMALLSLMGGAMTSCNNEDNFKNGDEMVPGVDFSDAEAFRVSVALPESEMKTRSQSPGLNTGDDGLLTFTRTIDRLWYAVYHQGTLLYHSEMTGIPQATYSAENGGFALDIQIPKINGAVKLEDYNVFFFAGNSSDKIATSEITDGIGLDFAAKTLYAYPTVVNKSVDNGTSFTPEQYDYFAKYTTLDKVCNPDFSGSVTLVRPFAQVTLLTDELRQNSVINTYASDGRLSVTTTPGIVTASGSSSTSTLPYGWNYDTDAILTKASQNLGFNIPSRAFDSSLNLKAPQEVVFKNRDMYCAGTYLMLAPSVKKPYANGQNSFAFNLTIGGDVNSTEATVSVDVPDVGLKANEKYVMYNKQYGGEGGTGGLFSSHYVIDVLVDPTWDNTVDSGF